MKKITAILLTLVCVLSINTIALAADMENAESDPVMVEKAETSVSQDGYADAIPGGAYIGNEIPQIDANGITSPLDYWNVNGWPEDVSFAYEAGGEIAADDKTVLTHWEIGVVNADEAREQEITAMFADTCLITFFDTEYSHEQREAILFEIETEVKANRDDNYLYGMLIKNTQQIYVVVKDAAFDEYSARYTNRYGDLVWTQRESESMVDETIVAGGAVESGIAESGIAIGGQDKKQNTWLLPTVLCAAVVIAALLFYFGRTKHTLAMQTNNGNIVTGGKAPTYSETIDAVKKSEYTPKDSVFDEIKKKL